jgi:hypothetical protein
MELLVKPEILTLYIYIYGPTFDKLKAVFSIFCTILLTLNQCRKLSCGTVVRKRFASYQDYPNYRWDLV